MKKTVAFLLAVIMVLALTGCMPAAQAPKVQKVTDPTSIEGITYDDFDDSLEGLCEYFAALGYAYSFPESTEDEVTDPVTMKADMIGAERGYKFTYTYGGETTVLELYYYADTENSYYKQAKSEGKITVSSDIENGTVDVTLSDNGKYMMIYSDTGENEEREQAILEAFKGFYA